MIITEKKKTLSKETKQTYNSKNNPKRKEKKKVFFPPESNSGIELPTCL